MSKDLSDQLNDKVEDQGINANAEDNTDDKLPTSKKKVIAIIVVLCLIVIALIIILLLIFVFDNDDNKDDNKNNYSDIIRLKNWEFISSKNVSDLTPEQISKGEGKFNKAPEDAYVCTAMGGLSGNTNDYYYERELQKVDDTQFKDDWWFRSKFNLDISDKDERLIILHVNGINYKADLYIDGNLVSNKENLIGTFVKYSFDIKKYLNKDSNDHYVAFKVQRPYNRVGDQYSDTDLAISFVDWNPAPPDGNMGVWQPVDVEIFNKSILTVSTAFVKTQIVENNGIKLEIVLRVKNWKNEKVNDNITVQLGDFVNLTLKDIVFEPLEDKQIIASSDNYRDLNIKYDPDKLWWPYQMGKSNMHKLIINISDYSFTKEIGLRQVDSEYDETKKIRVYKINNKKILLKGAGWSPDLFLRQDPQTYYKHVKYVRDMELNVIRLEGNSESEEFYDYCDKMGILLIQGWCCCDAWQRWDLWDEDVKALSDLSVISQIRKIVPHPSVIIFILGSDLAPTNGMEQRWRNIFTDEKWPNEILSSATQQGIDTGVKMPGPYSWVPPSYFYLEQSRNNDQGGAYGFLTEGGPGENPLRKGSYEKVFNEENMEKYDGDSWNYHCGTVNFANLDRFIEPLNKRFGNINDFNDFQRKSSAAVYEGHRAMFEAYESYRYDSTGIIQWMLNNAWPSNIWHLYDYFFSPTPSYFATKKSGERIHALYNYDDKKIYLINNYFDDFNKQITLKIYVISADGKTIKYSKEDIIFEQLKGDETINNIITLNGDYGDNYFVHLEYFYNDDNEKEIFASNTYFLNKEMDIMDFEHKPDFYNIPVLNYTDLSFLNNLQKVELDIEIISKAEYKDNEEKKLKYEIKITNKGDVIALLLELKLFYKISETNNDIIVPIIWNDNYFSIRGKNSYQVIVEFAYEEGKEIYLDIVGWNSELNKKIN